VRIVEIAVSIKKKIAFTNVKFEFVHQSPPMQFTITSFVTGMCNMVRFEPHDTFKIEKNRKNRKKTLIVRKSGPIVDLTVTNSKQIAFTNVKFEFVHKSPPMQSINT
jgi:hypothetical protein